MAYSRNPDSGLGNLIAQMGPIWINILEYKALKLHG